MITITLEVDQITDVAYQNLSVEHKQRLNSDIYALLLKTHIANVRCAQIEKNYLMR